MKKGLKITLIVVLSLVLVLGAGFAVVYATQKDYVENKVAMITKDDTEYFKWVTNRNVGKSLEEVKDSVSEYDKYTLKGDVDVNVSDEFFDLIKKPEFKGIKSFGLGSVLTVDNRDLCSEASIKYNGGELLKMDSLIRMDDKELYFSCPSYKSDVIDLTKLARTNLSSIVSADKINELFKKSNINFELKDSDLQDIFTLIDKLGGIVSTAQAGNKDREKLTENCSELIDEIFKNVDDATLAKDVKVSVADIDIECNTLTTKISQKQLFDMIYDSFIKIGEMYSDKMEEKGISKAQFDEMAGEIKKAFDEINSKEKLFSLELVAYVDSKGKIVGGNVKVNVKEQKFKIEMVREEGETTANLAIEVSLSGIKLVTITSSTATDDKVTSTNVKIKPGALIDQLTASIGKFSIEINDTIDKSDENDIKASIDFAVLNNSKPLLSLNIEAESLLGTADMPIDINSAKKVEYDKILESDYVDVKSVYMLLLNAAKSINDDRVTDAIKNLFKGLVGNTDSMSIDEIKNVIENQDFSSMNEQLKSILKNININDLLKKINGNSAAVPSGTAVSDKWDLFFDYEAERGYSNPEYASYVIPFEYEAVKDEIAGLLKAEVDYESAIQDFLDGFSVEKRLSADPSRVAMMGDDVLFDAVPLIFGVPMKDYEYTKVPTTMGRYEYGQGIDDMLVGLKAGESRVLKLTLDDRFGSFSGYSGDFKITISGIYDKIIPEWTEEYIVGELGYASLDECMQTLPLENYTDRPEPFTLEKTIEYLKENYLDKNKMNELYMSGREYALAEYDSFAKIYSDGAYESYLDYIKNVGKLDVHGYFRDMARNAVGYDDILAAEILESDVKDMIDIQVLTAYIAEKEGLTAKASEYDELCRSVWESENMDIRNVRELGVEHLYNRILTAKVEDIIFEKIGKPANEEAAK